MRYNTVEEMAEIMGKADGRERDRLREEIRRAHGERTACEVDRKVADMRSILM